MRQTFSSTWGTDSVKTKTVLQVVMISWYSDSVNTTCHTYFEKSAVHLTSLKYLRPACIKDLTCMFFLPDSRYLGQVVTVVSWGQEPNSTTATTATTTASPATANSTAASNTTAATNTTSGGRRRRDISRGKKFMAIKSFSRDHTS